MKYVMGVVTAFLCFLPNPMIPFLKQIRINIDIELRAHKHTLLNCLGASVKRNLFVLAENYFIVPSRYDFRNIGRMFS